MKTKIGGLLLLGMLLCGGLQAQTAGQDPFRDQEGNTWHQLFLDFQATEIVEMKYADNPDDIGGQLSPDGLSVLFKNYPGNMSVRLKVKDASGQMREVIKSKCFIDPVLLHL